jgi:hypothetical protein
VTDGRVIYCAVVPCPIGVQHDLARVQCAETLVFNLLDLIMASACRLDR